MTLKQFYSDWNERVEDTVSEGKLLVFNVKQGWGPLCEFLGVPIPDTPFPRVNAREEMSLNREKLIKGYYEPTLKMAISKLKGWALVATGVASSAYLLSILL